MSFAFLLFVITKIIYQEEINCFWLWVNSLVRRCFRVVEIECDPNSLKLSDFEEQVGLKDERFSERALISLEKAKFILREKTKGMIVEYETSLQDGRPVYEFDVFESDVGIEVEYEIDAETGLFLESEIELFEIGNP